MCKVFLSSFWWQVVDKNWFQNQFGKNTCRNLMQQCQCDSNVHSYSLETMRNTNAVNVCSSPTASAPVFVNNPVRVVATLGKDVLLECKPRASPKPRITWKRNDRRIQPSKRYSKSPRLSRSTDGNQTTSVVLEGKSFFFSWRLTAELRSGYLCKNRNLWVWRVRLLNLSTTLQLNIISIRCTVSLLNSWKFLLLSAPGPIVPHLLRNFGPDRRMQQECSMNTQHLQ